MDKVAFLGSVAVWVLGYVALCGDEALAATTDVAMAEAGVNIIVAIGFGFIACMAIGAIKDVRHARRLRRLGIAAVKKELSI